MFGSHRRGEGGHNWEGVNNEIFTVEVNFFNMLQLKFHTKKKNYQSSQANPVDQPAPFLQIDRVSQEDQVGLFRPLVLANLKK